MLSLNQWNVWKQAKLYNHLNCHLETKLEIKTRKLSAPRIKFSGTLPAKSAQMDRGQSREWMPKKGLSGFYALKQHSLKINRKLGIRERSQISHSTFNFVCSEFVLHVYEPDKRCFLANLILLLFCPKQSDAIAITSTD